MSGAPEEPQVACTWCGLFSTPDFCDSCGSPLPVQDLSVRVSDGAPAEGIPLAEEDPLPPVAPFEGVPNPYETFALVEDRAPHLAVPSDPEPNVATGPFDPPLELPVPVDQPLLDSPLLAAKEMDAAAEEEEPPPAFTRPSDPIDEEPATRASSGAAPAPKAEEVAAREPEPVAPSDEAAEAAEAEPPQGPRCPSCGRPGSGGLCDACREAIRELSGLSR